MKQRFSSLDVKVIAHELQESLVSLRLANVYDLSSKILLLKFAKSENKKQLIIDSGFRCHLTDFARTTAASPSQFVARLRKFLKTRRVTAVGQVGTDRILEFQFSDGQYRLFLEFFASGNVILTDADLNILTLLRIVPEGEGQEPQRVGLSYSLENRQNYGGVPPLTKERIRAALQSSAEKVTSAAATATGKKLKRKAGDELRKGLATTITELPPILVDHAFAVNQFDPTTSLADVLAKEELLESLYQALTKARAIVEKATSAERCTGYIVAKRKSGSEEASAEDGAPKREELLYEDFQPFLPHKFANDPSLHILTFDGYNKTVDEFFSSLEGQKLESRLSEREEAAKRKLESARREQAKRIEGLQDAQLLNLRKAAAIEANVERVEEAMGAVTGLLQQGMDWVDIGKLVEREQKRNNPVAAIIKLPLRLQDNVITLLIGEEEVIDDEEEAYETDSDVDDDDDAATEASRQKGIDRRLQVDIDLTLTPWANAREYYDEKRSAAVKEQKTVQQSAIALKNQEQKIAADLKKGLKQEKAVLQPIRKALWFEKFIWFMSSDGYLVLGGRDAQQNEMLYKRYLRKGDVYCHADLHGAATVIIKNNPSTPDAPIPPSTLSQAGSLSVCCSNAWDSKAVMAAWWVNADQVSKSAPTGEFLPTGSFMVRGKKNYLPPAQLLLGFGVMFKISDESKARHIKHRLQDAPGRMDAAVEESNIAAESSGSVKDDEFAEDESDDGSVDEPEEENLPASNPLQTTKQLDKDEYPSDAEDPPEDEVADDLGQLAVSEKPALDVAQKEADENVEDEMSEELDVEGEEEPEPDDFVPPSKTSKAPSSVATTSASTKKVQPKRGQRGKAKKLAKYKDQDEDDRAAIEALIGSAAGRQRAEAEAKAKAEKEAELAAAKERRRAQHEKRQKETAEHEEVRRMMLDEGVELLEPDEADRQTPLDALVGTPLVGDEILEVIPVCAPWNALARVKYKAKLQPGTVKKGKAVKEVLERWKAASSQRGVLDEKSLDKERMWPREVELIKALKAEEVVNCVPVSKVRVMMAGSSGGSGGGGGGGGSGGKGQGKAGRGGRGSKRK